MKKTAKKQPKAAPTTKFVVDQLAKREVTLSVRPQDANANSYFDMELTIYTSDGSASIRKRRYLPPLGEAWEDVQLPIAELEGFAEGVAELVRVAKAEGFLTVAQA